VRLRKAIIVIVPEVRTDYLLMNCEDFVRSLNENLGRRRQGEVVSAVFDDSGVTVKVKVTSVSGLMDYVLAFGDALSKAGEKLTISVRSGREAYEVSAAGCSCRT
jgi:hypothetical protein